MKDPKNRKKFPFGWILQVILLSAVSYPVVWLLVFLWDVMDAAIERRELLSEDMRAIYTGFFSIAGATVVLLFDHFKSDRQKEIEAEFRRDQTSICPRCGGEDIKVYPKGYNYNLGFWGTLMGSKTAPFLAGLDSDTACCRCRNCGKKWETPYSYRENDF